MNAAKMEIAEVPYIDISVPAGFPSPASDYIEERINLNNFLIRNPLSTFIIKCTGLSMVDAFMPPLCHLVVDRSLKPNNGDIVLAYLNGGFTVKYLQVNDYKCRLIPANRKMREIEIPDPSELIIWGVVTAIISNPKDFRNVCFG
ncbi:LexA family protein [Terrimonas alba]|uniref:LexA family protein n=1 Tax=Terrimonas alba TaxID=3349636 RepID=UPI0035F43E40